MRRRAALLGAALAAAGAQGLAVELSLSQKDPDGPFAAQLAVGTPPQRVWLRVDSASQWTYVLDAGGFGGTGGYSSENSSTAKLGEEKSITFMDGSGVSGVLLSDVVEVGGVRAASVPLLLAQNATPPPAVPDSLGLLGLICLRGSDFGADAWNPFGGGLPEQGRLLQRGLFQYFWEQHAEVPQTFQLELGGPAPRLLVGAVVEERPREEGGAQFLSTVFTSRSSQWFASVRAMGLSKGGSAPFLHWNLDFNALVPYGAPALLDSGSRDIRLGSVVYGRFLQGLPRDCTSTLAAAAEEGSFKGTTCPCTESSIEEDFPSISLSFETAETYRFLGLDSGADVIVCIPPQAYVRYDSKLKSCLVSVSDGGPHHMKFGFEAIVLGLPFFRSTAVVLDTARRRIGLGPALALAPAAPAKAGQWDPRGGAAEGPSIERLEPQKPCVCADPKNWWSTGRRFSPRRVLVVIIGVTVLVAYVFVAHSPSPAAEGLRELAERLCGSSQEDYGQGFAHDGFVPDGVPANGAPAGAPGFGGAGSSSASASGRSSSGRRRGGSVAAAAAAERRFTDNAVDRPLIQMADRGETPP